jgi:8-oxoguanine deaminase
MSTLLVRHATVLVTQDAGRREIADGGLFARDGIIEQVGPTAELPAEADEVLDLDGHVVLPGLVNTHHHLYQTLTRAVPAAQDADLFHWLVTLYPIWARLTPEAVRVSTQVGLAELALSGCTTASDHLYIFPNGCRLDDEIEAATQLGVRFHATRGSMSLGESQGGLPPDRCVEDEAYILKDSQRLIEQYHHAGHGALLRIALAPCSPFSVTKRLMRETAALAERFDCALHTHLGETADEDAYCLSKYQCRPVDLLEETGWLNDRAWLAHGVHFDDSEVARLGRHGVGVCHCATSNMVLASGVCRTKELEAAGVRVGLGVDGSASNDSSNMMEAVRHALMIGRLRYGAAAVTHLDVLRWATEGGAKCLRRADIGRIAPGMQADFALFALDEPRFSGAHDPLAALVLCGAHRADRVMVAGEWKVIDGAAVGVDLGELIARHSAAARRFA